MRTTVFSKDNKLITIITPTFNRSKYLNRLYLSLQNQKEMNFIWLIIDDGSNDDTYQIVQEFLSDQIIDIVYIYQENKGKHVAVNKALAIAETELVFIVDSDDFLVRDATRIISIDWNDYSREVIGISYLRSDLSGNTIGKSYSSDYMIDTYERIRIINRIDGDKAEVWNREVFYCHPFLEFESEKFFSEQYSYLKMSGSGKILFRNMAIYKCEYLPGGLSKKIRVLQWENPYGTLANAIQASKPTYGFEKRTKSFLIIVAFSIRTKSSLLRNLYNSDYNLFWMMILPVGIILLLYYYAIVKLKYLTSTK